VRSNFDGYLVVGSLWPLLVIMVFGACGCTERSRPKQSTPLASVAPSRVLQGPASVAASDASVTRGLGTVQDLLGIVPAKVAVSSAVRNPRDFPEHLIDGNPNTAWNSRTGDLAGAWIAFRVPADAHIDAIELTAGYVRVKGEQDLFRMNHRIKRVEILRDGQPLKVAGLDVESRVLQRVPIDTAGGEFKVLVKETLPGSEVKWREVVVSEFRVLGKPGSERRGASERIVVSIGSLDATPPEPITQELDVESRAFAPESPSVDAFCNDWLVWAKAHAAAEIAETEQWNDSAPVAEPVCSEVRLPPLQNAASPWTDVKGVRMAWAFHDATHLFVVTPKGIRMTPIYFDDQRGNGMGCPAIWSREHLDRLRVESGWLIATIDGTGPTNYDRDTHVQTTMYQRGLAMCRMAGKEFHCLELNPQYAPSLATKTYRSAGGRAQQPDDVPWEREEDFHVNEKGEISRLRVR